MKAFVLAAGYATRLHPLTIDRAKPLLGVGGVPILTRVVERLTDIEALTEVVVVTNHRFHHQFAAWAADLPPGPVPLRLLDDGTMSEEHGLGAVGTLSFALRRVPPRGEPFVVAAGDAIFDFDLRPLHQAFVDRAGPLLVVRNEPHDGGPTRYNEVKVDADGLVTSFREKPPNASSGLAAIALYFFPPEVYGLVDRYLEGGGNPDAPGHFVGWLVDQMQVSAAQFEATGRWVDIGTHETLAAARALFADEE